MKFSKTLFSQGLKFQYLRSFESTRALWDWESFGSFWVFFLLSHLYVKFIIKQCSCCSSHSHLAANFHILFECEWKYFSEFIHRAKRAEAEKMLKGIYFISKNSRFSFISVFVPFFMCTVAIWFKFVCLFSPFRCWVEEWMQQINIKTFIRPFWYGENSILISRKTFSNELSLEKFNFSEKICLEDVHNKDCSISSHHS
jgi:hypothetical protein